MGIEIYVEGVLGARRGGCAVHRPRTAALHGLTPGAHLWHGRISPCSLGYVGVREGTRHHRVFSDIGLFYG